MYDLAEEARLARVRLLLKMACQIGHSDVRAGDAIVASAANILAGVVRRQDRKAQVIPFRPRTK
ncbi:MAG: hypothetical protein IT364_16630 [Candidatus Hydrogenedentes bacterium]|nr:hypothetical protein [Candidatus Hydrogenedentota bacterium]